MSFRGENTVFSGFLSSLIISLRTEEHDELPLSRTNDTLATLLITKPFMAYSKKVPSVVSHKRCFFAFLFISQDVIKDYCVHLSQLDSISVLVNEVKTFGRSLYPHFLYIKGMSIQCITEFHGLHTIDCGLKLTDAFALG